MFPDGFLRVSSFDLAIYDEAGEELFKQERFSGFQYQGREKVRELYVNMEIKVTGLPSGNARRKARRGRQGRAVLVAGGQRDRPAAGQSEAGYRDAICGPVTSSSSDG